MYNSFCRCLPTKWNGLMKRFVEDVYARQQLLFTFSELRYSPFRIQIQKLCQNSMNRPFYRYGGCIELIRRKEYYRMPRGAWAHFVCIFERFSGHFSRHFLKVYISNTKLEKGDHYYIKTRHKDLFSHYSLILRKL